MARMVLLAVLLSCALAVQAEADGAARAIYQQLRGLELAYRSRAPLADFQRRAIDTRIAVMGIADAWQGEGQLKAELLSVLDTYMMATHGWSSLATGAGAIRYPGGLRQLCPQIAHSWTDTVVTWEDVRALFACGARRLEALRSQIEP